MAKKDAARLAELNGAPPRLASSEDLQAAGPKTGRAHAVQKSAKTSSAPHRINLKAVSEALVEEGLDPAVEIARVLKGEIVYGDDGQPCKHPITGEVLRRYAIDADTRVRTLNEVLQYTQPKLKAVEVKVSGALELTGEQLDDRIAALMAKAQGAKR